MANERRRIMNALLAEKIKENEMSNKAEKERKQTERDLLRKFNEEMAELEKQEKLSKLNRKNEIAKNLSGSYAEQLLEKKKQIEFEKMNDKIILQNDLQKPHNNEVEIRKVIFYFYKIL